MIAPVGATGPQGMKGAQGLPGPQGATGATGHQGPMGPIGPSGMRGEIGPVGPMGPRGPQGATGATGSGVTAAPAYCGMFNIGGGEVEIAADEVAAMTFSDFMPIVGAWYDEHHSVVVTEPGLYEINCCMRATSIGSGTVQIAITNDGVIIPSSAVIADFGACEPFSVYGFSIAEIQAGSHLHFIAYSKEGAQFQLNDGVNLSMLAKKIADSPGACRV